MKIELDYFRWTTQPFN